MKLALYAADGDGVQDKESDSDEGSGYGTRENCKEIE
jgi:hypothetical protein